jgi:tetratricopeptide (TPR) repeat protein
MRIVALCLGAFLAFSPVTFARAAEDAPPPGNGPATALPSKASELDDLFKTLQSTKDEAAAKIAEARILQLWLESGSDTIDLLMGWAINATEEKDYATALDLLDRVTTLKPDYAEGWNKRATVYFLTDDYAKSLSDIRRTLALEPRHFGALSGLGMIMRALGDNSGAITAFKQALAADPFLSNVKDALGELEKEAAGRDI